MTDTLTQAQFIHWLEISEQTLKANKDLLGELDSAIGDGDHGINMARGFGKVSSQLPAMRDKNIGRICKVVGMALISSVGGASGPLYGTMFMRAGLAAGEKRELSPEELGAMLKLGVDGVIERGRARLGDKTMVDALAPAAQAFRDALSDKMQIGEAMASAVQAAEEGVEATIPLKAKKGRASYLGERSIGHQDPGATSSYLILKALNEALQGETEE